LFGFDFPDKELWKVSNGQRLYTSQILNDIWGQGYCVIGDVTFESAAYVARYIMKKVTGKKVDKLSDFELTNGDIIKKRHYELFDFETGEIIEIEPEYTTMSRRPGIGSDWFDKYSSDVYPHDFVVVNGKKVRPPKFYDTKYFELNPDEFESIKDIRSLNSEKFLDNNSSDRLLVREECLYSRISKLVRPLE
jgi:hypothetical protein